jgi:DNA-binding NarL/FixJ family response regulator
MAWVYKRGSKWWIGLRSGGALIQKSLKTTIKAEAMAELKRLRSIEHRHAANSVYASLPGFVAHLPKTVRRDQFLAVLNTRATIDSGPKLKPNKPGSELAVATKTAGNLLLNAREKEILKNLAEGLLYKEISQKLGISYSAVHKSLHAIYKKFQVRNRSEAIRLWLNNAV